MEKPDFVAKYGPLLQILNGGEDDFSELAAQLGYTENIGRMWRNAHCRAVLGYIRTLRTDYEVLWQQISGSAVTDASLGALLGETEARIRRLIWRLRAYVVVQRLAPVPRQGRVPRLRSLVLRALPKPPGLDVKEILLAMEALHELGRATVFLP